MTEKERGHKITVTLPKALWAKMERAIVNDKVRGRIEGSDEGKLLTRDEWIADAIKQKLERK